MKIYTAESSAEAETIIGWLRTKGLHPAELGLTTPLAAEHTDSKFPIEVPIEEAEQAASDRESASVCQRLKLARWKSE